MQFRIFGPLEVVEGGKPLDLGGQQQRALLVTLLLDANRTVSSDRLLEVLWGDSPPATAAKALQVHISHLRKLLGRERVITRPPGYELRVDPDEFDLDRFEQLWAQGRLHDALAQWRSEALPEFSYHASIGGEIARLEERRLICLEKRIDEDLEAGLHDSLVPELESLTREHPLREGLRTRLMLALYRSHRQAEALQVYQDARQLLTNELGIEPGRSLRELQQAILRQESSLDVPAPSEPAAEEMEPARGVFIGRERELDELLAALDNVFAGRGGLFLIAGEPGIGKSRLADELSRRARARGASALVGRCWEAGGAPAFWPWVQPLRQYVRETEVDELRSQLGSGAADLAQILPELRERFPDLPEPATEVEGARFRLFDAMARFLVSASHSRPLVLVLDDLHAADEPSLLMLRFVAGEIGDSRILLTGTYRDVDPTVRDPLASTLAELVREKVTRRIVLSGLTLSDVARYIELAAGIAPSDEVVSTIHSETEGNPLFVGEVVRLLGAEGQLADVDAKAVWSLGVPQGIREVIGRRVGRLSAPCISMLTLAAILGREFELNAVERLSDLSGDDLFEALDEAVAARVLASVPGAPSRRRLRFAHALIRETLYDRLTNVRRVQMHRRAGEVLEALYELDPETHLAELAFHFFEAAPGGDTERAVAYARRAGERALALLAYEEAARLFELGLQALELDKGAGASVRCELLLALGDALAKAGSTPEAKETFLAAADLARKSKLAEHLARAALGYGGRFPWLRGGSDTRIVPLLEEALAALDTEDSELRVRLLARLAGALRDQPSLEPRSTLGRQAVEIARRLGEPDTLGYALVSYGTATWAPDVQEFASVADEVTRLADETGNGEQTLLGGWLHHIVAMTHGERARVEALATADQALADELKQPSQQWYSTMRRCVWALFEGRFRDAEQLAEEALRHGERAMAWDAGCSYRLVMFVLRREQGRLEEIESLVRRAVDDYPGYRAFPCLLTLLACELRRDEAAGLAFEDLATGQFAKLPRDCEWLFCLSILAEVACYLEDRSRASTLYELLRPFAGLNALVAGEVALGAVSRYLGILAAAMERWDDAERQFDDALEMNERMGGRPWVAHTKEDFARMLLARGKPGDTTRAEQLLNEALAMYRESGMSGPLERAQAFIRA